MIHRTMIVELIALRYRIKTNWHLDEGVGSATVDLIFGKYGIKRIQRKVNIPVVITNEDFITCLHELGHCIHPRGLAIEEVCNTYNNESRIPRKHELNSIIWERELAAWAWAYSFIKWHNKRLKAELIDVMYRALRTYYIRIIQGKWGPQRRDRYTQDMELIEDIFLVKLEHDNNNYIREINVNRGHNALK